jgi:RNA polymerase sigma-70 factor (ECF subfamily)
MPADAGLDARAAAEIAARTSYGRLLAVLVRRTRDIAAAEDALAEAFRSALEAWPVKGIPDAPDAWLLTAARRAAGHASRHAGVARNAEDAIEMLIEERSGGGSDFPDERLKLMFICAHPAIDESVRTPLMLQTVLGLDAERIAAAFLMQPAAMGQRLVRAKAKIRDAGIGFTTPERADWPERLEAVLAAIYAAYGAGWEDATASDSRLSGLTGEAIFLGRMLSELLPDEPEAKGLLALMLYCEARRPARRDGDGAFVPLAEQDILRWDGVLIAAAERLLRAASAAQTFGRYQTEAAIQSVHSSWTEGAPTKWRALVALYDLLAEQAPTVGNLIARAAAYGEAKGPEFGLALLSELPEKAVISYQPYWATRAALLRAQGDVPGADEAYARAVGLTVDPALKAFLAQQRGSPLH